MKIAFIDHSYHQKTRSSAFFTRLLFPEAEVDIYWDESWLGVERTYLDEVEDRGYDLLIVFQMEFVARELARRALRNSALRVLFVPMWDGCRGLGGDYWRELGTVRILSFCRALHEQLRGYGLASCYGQYFPDPAHYPEITDYSSRRGFFWPRVDAIRWPQIRALIGSAEFASFHLHLSLDPGTTADTAAMPCADEISALNITTSTWLQDAAQFRTLLAQSNVFFAPRLSEGIGISMLEAMAMGMCVVGNRMATMNEYIVSGINGLLADFTAPAPLDLGRFEALGRRARDYVAGGHKRWQQQLPALRQFALPSSRSVRALSRGCLVAAPLIAAQLMPRLSVAVFDSGSAEALAVTLASVWRQDFPHLECVLISREEATPTLEIRAPLQHVAATGLGAGEAVQAAAEQAGGDYILYLAAGEYLFGNDAASRCLHNVPRGTDFVIGHYLRTDADGVDRMCRAADFDESWARLRAGRVDRDWLAGLPSRAAMLIRRDLLCSRGCDDGFRSALLDEFALRLRAAGACFHHSLETIAVVPDEPADAASERMQEWAVLAERYGGAAAAAFFSEPSLPPPATTVPEPEPTSSPRRTARRLLGRTARRLLPSAVMVRVETGWRRWVN